MRAFARARTPLAAPPVGPVPASRHNDALAAAHARADELEAKLVALLIPVLEQAADVAARNFEALATDHLAASGRLTLTQDFGPDGVTADGGDRRSTMVAVKPRPEQAAALAEPGEQPPETMHVTLAYLGKTEGPLEDVARALAGVPGEHAPLEGVVGGVGSFQDNGNGHPAILLPSVPGLLELRHHVTEALAARGIEYGRDYGFVPHLTVAYRADGPDPPAISSAGAPLSFDDLWIVRGDVETVQLPLVGAKPVTAGGYDPFGFRAFADQGNEQIVAELERVAEAHKPEGGYGDTWWSPSTATVFWCSADWSTTEECEVAEAAFLAVDGVERFAYDAEVGQPDGGDGADDWERVWPPAEPLTAAADDGFCLPASVRGITDPVRQAAVESVMRSSLEHVGVAFDPVNPLAAKVLSQSASQIQGIAETTQLDVMKTIRAAHDAGLSIPDTAKSIRAVMAEAAPARATLIARTELAGAVHGGSLAATKIVAQVTGANYTKTWRTAPGATYPRHEDYEGLDGQTVGLDETFDVGGSDLEFPGDPGGPPEEVCNCRCSMTYTDEGGGGEVEASAAPAEACTAHDRAAGASLAAEIAWNWYAATAAGPAGWTSPAPDEVLPIHCEAPAASRGIDAGVGKPEEPAPAAALPGPPVGDTVSVGPAPYVTQSALSTIERLGLDGWPPEKGPEALRILGPATDTTNLYAPNGIWPDERAALQQGIVDRALEGKVAARNPTAYFTAGGGASGKSALTFDVGGRAVTTDALGARRDTVLVDPDAIKKMLPEYQAMFDASDPYASMGVHEESSMIAKEIVEEAKARGISVVYDTTGSSGEFVAKVEAAADAGYRTQVAMMSVPTNEAIMRSLAAALHVGPREGRFVPIQSLKYAHAGASRNAEVWMADPKVGRWTIWDNSGAAPRLIASGAKGATEAVNDQTQLDAILAKGKEGLPHSAAAPEPAPPAPIESPSGGAFLNDGDAQTYLDEREAAWGDALTQAQHDALAYWRTPDGYREISAALRDGEQVPPKLAATIAQIDAAIASAAPLDEGVTVTVYRGVTDTARFLGDDPQVGDRFVDPGYQSATTEASVAHDYALGGQDSYRSVAPTMIQIELPPGDLRGAWLRAAGVEPRGATAFEDRVLGENKEIVLPRDVEWEVVRIGDENDLVTFEFQKSEHPLPLVTIRPVQERAAVDTGRFPLSDLPPLPTVGDDYVRSLQDELRKLGKSIAANNYTLKTETRADRIETLKAQIKAWETRRDDVRALIASPDPRGELARLGKQIAAARFEIKNGRGGARLEARLKALERRREALRKVMNGPLKDEIKAEQRKVQTAQEVKGESASRTQVAYRPGDTVDLTGISPYTSSGASWAEEVIPGYGPENYLQLPPSTMIEGVTPYRIGPSVIWKDADTGAVVRRELPADLGGQTPAQYVAASERDLRAGFSDYPDEMKGQLRQIVFADRSCPIDDDFARRYGRPGFRAAATAGQSEITYWNGNVIADDPGGKAIFDHEMGHILGEAGGPHDDPMWMSAQAGDRRLAVDRFGADAADGRQRPAEGGFNFALGASSVTEYGGVNLNEDWAESIRLFLLDRRRGWIGDVAGEHVRFAEAYPGRARLIRLWLNIPD